jgi:hypothetical protein
MVWLLLVAAPFVLVGIISIAAAVLGSRCDQARHKRPESAEQAAASHMPDAGQVLKVL